MRKSPAENRRGEAVLAPGFGGGSTQPLLVSLSKRLAEQGVEAKRISFARVGRPSEGLAREQGVVERAVAKLRGSQGELPLFLVGRSFGGRVCGRLSVREPPRALILLGFPLAPGGKLREEDDRALRTLSCPTLIVQGDADPLGPLALIRSAVRANSRLSLHVLPKTGHSFDTVARTKRVLEASAEFVATFL